MYLKDFTPKIVIGNNFCRQLLSALYLKAFKTGDLSLRTEFVFRGQVFLLREVSQLDGRLMFTL